LATADEEQVDAATDADDDFFFIFDLGLKPNSCKVDFFMSRVLRVQISLAMAMTPLKLKSNLSYVR
jgi:hypothetical protein